ncbi:MAG: hypothetical protein B6D46_06800 [Polyangiaceae bacterium UTPRO1]|jgi:hypothetical protein|nr:hypothetical protein [Myxococcales bacterium]OQY67734.1 MAG: hypothetical protein B6D46_06800 [Polyangiaceae bacterium UTPRO1]
MKTHDVRNLIAAAVAGGLLLAAAASAAVVGVVTAVSKRDLTVSGAVYPIDDGVALEDMTGQRITWPEIRPGVSVELDFDEEGRLVTIRANVVR